MESLTEQDQLEVEVDDGKEEEGTKDEPIIVDSINGEFTRQPGKELVIEEVTTKPLLAPKQDTQSQRFLELFKQVKINLPLLEVIKQVSAYAKFIKDIYTFKDKLVLRNERFLPVKLALSFAMSFPRSSKIWAHRQSPVLSVKRK